jgi:hypothetical protein
MKLNELVNFQRIIVLVGEGILSMDKGDNGEDLTGGYFDAGDFVKFGFPMAGFTTLLAWGAIDYEDAYVQAGELEQVRQAIRWSTDYFIKVSFMKSVLS